jgi:MtN3 and saliva related transmembrane protein
MMTDLIGSIAAILTTIAFVPQVIQIWKTRSARDVSLPMYLVFTTGLALWLVYGVLVMSWPIIIANIVTIILALCVIAMKLKWG